MMISLPQNRRWLCLPVAFLGLAFYIVQIWAQRPAYWQGDYAAAWSWSPVYRWTMSIHPAAFLGQGVVEIMLFSIIIILIPIRLSRVFSTWAALSYTLGTASWLRVSTSYWLLFSLVFVPAILISWSIQQSLRGQQSHGEATSDAAPSAESKASHA
jgi:hypothetical protein